MNLCNCPICGNKATFVKDIFPDKDEKAIYCEECKKRGLTIEVRGKGDVFELVAIWNTRPIHEKAIEDCEFLYDFLNAEKVNDKGLLEKVIDDEEKYSFWNAVFGINYSPCAGFILTKDCKIHECFASHFDTLVTLLNLDSIPLLQEHSAFEYIRNIAVKKGIIICTYFSKSLIVEMNPVKVSDEQIMCLFKEFIDNRNDKYKSVVNFSIRTLPQDLLDTYTWNTFQNALLTLK